MEDHVALILELFESCDVVLLGESHGVAGNFEFLRAALPVLHRHGVNRLAIEFGAAEFQDRADALVTSHTYDPACSRMMLRGYNAGWPYTDYQEIYRRAWELNASSPGLPTFRIVHASYVYDWTRWSGVRDQATMDQVMHRGHYNEFRADRICEEIQAGQKVLGLFGALHAFRGELPDEFTSTYDTTRSLGNLLERRMPGRVASVCLNPAFPGVWDARFTTAPQVPCAIDYAFLEGIDFSEIQRAWPDPDWTPIPDDEAEYWRVVEARKPVTLLPPRPIRASGR